MQSHERYTTILTICQAFSSAVFNSEGNVTRRGPKPKASDLEIVALSIYQSFREIESESYFFHLIEQELPDLAKRVGTRRNYNQRRKAVFPYAEKLRGEMAKAMRKGNPENIFVIDSMPVEVCRFARAKNSRAFREDFSSAPTYGYCAAHKQHYFGYKLHVVCTPDGIVEYFDLTPANLADIGLLPEVRRRFSECVLLGDAGYLNHDTAMDLFEYARIQLIVPYRKNMIQVQKLPKGFGPARKRVEVVFSQLVSHLQVRRMLAKRQKGLFGRVVSKVCLFTLLQYVNFINDNPISRVRYTLVA